MLDRMATRYHYLPSQILSSASTLDLYVMNNAMSYYKRQQDSSQTMAGSDKPSAPELSQDEMMTLLNKTKAQNGTV